MSDDWKTIEAAFQRALDLPESERDEFLKAFEAETPHLAQQLRDLLVAHETGDDGLAGPIAVSVEALVNETDDPWIGRAVGAWKITRRIAAGGMGAVFLAERSDKQFEQRVAIKVMSAQLLASDAVARFKAERQILANLQHPYIAQLHDGGTTEDGLPYLVMEYVEGRPIDIHCDEQQLGIDERLRLFQKVCQAVDYAHRNLTVHRDLKPSNILIDARGAPRLLDFGIAKLLDARAMNLTVAMTRQGARAMTPEYASPEQVRGEPVSIATDVYSLGVLLYRLMTGTSPYGTDLTSPLEYERAIIEHDPRRPSTVITSQDSSATAGTGRAASSERLRKRLVGDLDNIALKTLQKEPERRYLTVGALVDDIERFLRHEPVEARGDEWIYRARKFAVRNARALAIAGVIVVGAASMTTYYTVRLADERDRANLAAAESNEVSTFLEELFERASPIIAQGETPTAIDLLQYGREKVEQLDGQPLVQAELLRVIGDSFIALGDYDTALPLVSRSLEIRSSEDFDDPLAIAESLDSVAEVHRELRQHDQALEHIRHALAIREAELGKEHPETVRTLGRLGANLHTARREQEALSVLEEALELKRRISPTPDFVTLDILGVMAVSLDTAGRYEEAVELGREAIELSNLIIGENHPDTVIRMSNLALVLRRLFRLEESAEEFARTIERAKLVWPSNHPRLGFYVQSHGTVLESLGRFDEGLVLHEESASITRAGAGEESTAFAGNLYGRGRWQMRKALYDDAVETLQRGLDTAAAIQDENGYFVVLLTIYLGEANARIGRTGQAEELLRRAVEKQGHVGKDHALYAQLALASLLSETGRNEEAETLFDKTIAEKEANTQASRAPLIEFYTALAAHFRRSGNFDEALGYARRAHSIAESELPKGNWMAALGTAEYARTLDAMNRKDEARQYFVQAYDSLLGTFGADDPRVVELANFLN